MGRQPLRTCTLTLFLLAGVLSARATADEIRDWLSDLGDTPQALSRLSDLRQRHPDLLTQLVRLSGEPQAEVQAGARRALRSWGEDEEAGLGRGLAELIVAEDSLRSSALACLAQLSQLRDVQELCRRVFKSRVPIEHRLGVARRLGEVGARGALPAIASSLGRERDQLERRWQSWTDCVLAVAALRLDGSRPEERLDVLLELALEEEAELAGHALEGVRLYSSQQLKQRLLPEIEGGSYPERRVRALTLISFLRLRALSPKVQDVAADEGEHWSVRRAAVWSLGELRSGHSVAYLARLLSRSGRSEPELVGLRREAADALAKFDSGEVGRNALEAVLTDPEASIRRAALRGLASYGDPASRGALDRLLAFQPVTGSTAERLARVEACARVGLVEGQAVGRLFALLREDEDILLGEALLNYSRGVAAEQAEPFLRDAQRRHPRKRVREGAASELVRRREQPR